MTHEPSNPRRKRLRAQGFDYAEPGTYFVTTCVDQMEHRFGQVRDGFVVMPNHVHGILILGSDASDHPTSLSRITQTFKSESTVEYGRGVKAGRFPRYDRALWQRGFHDKILRDDRMLEAARLYIESNPGRWDENRGGCPWC